MKISVIVPVYNVEKYLDKCLDSLLNQSVNNFEVIIVNDGTKDNSQDIIDKYVKKDIRFKSYIKENGGLSDARNYGIKKASGEYLIFIDSDDYVELNLVEECLKKINDYDLIIFEYQQLDVINTSVELINNKFEENIAYNLLANPNLLVDIHNCAWNKCYKAELFNDIEYPKGFLYEDLGTTYRLISKATKVGFINKPLVNYLLNRDGNITSSLSDKIFDIFEMCKINIEYFKDNNLWEANKVFIAKLCWKNIVECLRKLPKRANKEFTNSFIDMAFDFKQMYFKGINVSLANSLSDNIYESRLLCKLYMKAKGFKDE